MAESVAEIVRRARAASGLSQRELARKARTAQSVVARAELGENSPSWDTLMRLLKAAGYTLRTQLEPVRLIDRSILDDVPRILRMTPQQRLEEVAQVSRFVATARRV
jgi:transcriptional regulator with XRE-family HTH domain